MSRLAGLDFDGVLNSYAGWVAEDVIDAPVEGAVTFVAMLQDAGFEVVVSSTRARTARGKSAISYWLGMESFPRLEITSEKVPAAFTLDDRGLRFEGPGKWPTLAEVEAACVPWNRRDARPNEPWPEQR